MSRRKKRSSHKHSSHKRRRVGAIGKDSIMGAVGLVAGAYVSNLVINNQKIDALAKLDDKLKSAITIALGYGLPMIWKKPIAKSLGDGMIAYGGVQLLQSTGVLSGIDDALEIPVSVVAGDGSNGMSVVAGKDDGAYDYAKDTLSVLSGTF